MSEISIRQLEEFTGIKSHTLRIWEKRFNLFTPVRKKGNIRYYSVDDFRYLLNIAFLNRNGIKISRIVAMTRDEVIQAVGSYNGKSDRLSLFVNKLVVAMFAFDVEYFEDTLNHCQEEFGLDALIAEVIIPFLEKTGLVYYKDRSNETHFAITSVRKKIITAIDNCSASVDNAKSALLFLPEGEHYDLILLYISYLLKCNGTRVIYLGTNVPDENIMKVIEVKQPDLVYVHVPPRKKYNPAGIANFIHNNAPDAKFFVVYSSVPRSLPELNKTRFIHFTETLSTIAS